MFGQNAKQKKQAKDAHTKKRVEHLNRPLQGGLLCSSLAENKKLLDALFVDVDIMLSRSFQNSVAPDLDFCIYYSDGVTDVKLINEHIIKPLLLAREFVPGPGLFEQVKDQLIQASELTVTSDLQQIVEAITYGDSLLLIEGCAQGIILGSKQFVLRAVTEPEGEKVLSGPREGFTEGLVLNISMLRRRLRTNQFKVRFKSIGKQTNTGICICYMDNIVNKDILEELYLRLKTVQIDGILDSNYIAEFIGDGSFLGFTTTGYTERPDVVVAKLLEGHIAIMVDGTPTVLTIPYLFVENFQSNEDYYMNFYYTSFTRMLRIVGFFLTITVPAFYITIVCYHHEVIPPDLLINITSERQGVPFPAAMEAFIMLLIFDILRETGVRMPNHVGQALSIVGALVIGQAAVEAKMVAAPMIIVVAFTGITNLLVPKIGPSALLLRYFFLLLSSIFGMLGLVVGISMLLIHILNLQSYGVPALLPLNQLGFQEFKDSFFRAPWPKMRRRPSQLTNNTTRAVSNNANSSKDGGDA